MEKFEPFLNILVELARLGASGVAIFSIFWIGNLIKGKTEVKNDQMHTTLRHFMLYSGVVLFALVGAEVWGRYRTGGGAELDELKRVYTVIGSVKPVDGSPCPGGIVFNQEYPDPTVERGSGRISSLKIRKDASGRFPDIGVSGERIFQTSLDIESALAQGHASVSNSSIFLTKSIDVQLKPEP